MKKRYTVEQTKHKEWFNIIDNKKNRSFWMHITDFGIVNRHLPKYCTTEAYTFFDSTTQGTIS